MCTATPCQAVDMKNHVAASAPGHHARVEDSGWVAQHMHQADLFFRNEEQGLSEEAKRQG